MDQDMRDVLAKFVLQQNHMNFDDFQARNDSSQAPLAGPTFSERDDSWSIIWYIASFSGLIAFFLIVSCSEWCCRLHVRAPRQPAQPLRPSSSGSTASRSFQTSEAPPPAYDLFAPPSYDSVNKAGVANAALEDDRPHEKSEYDIYVVPVHAIRMLQDDPGLSIRQDNHSISTVVEDDPPSYISVQMNNRTMS